MTSRPAAACITMGAVVTVVSAGIVAQVRDPSAATPAATGTAIIAGRVIAEPGGAPLRGAIVTLREDVLPLGRTAVTDDTGAFVFDALPAGHATIAARKPAYLPMNLGARYVDQSGAAIALAAGQRVEGQTITLPRGAVLTGTIVDAIGVPMPGLNVFAARRDPAHPENPFTAAGANALTDDRGGYRIFGLPPGEYLIGASTGQISMGGAAARSDEAVDAALRALESRATGSDPAQRTLAPVEHAAVQASSAAFSNLYYPGTPDSANAQVIRLKVGEERTGIDFAMTPTPTATIDGMVSSPPNAGSPSMVLTPQGQQVRMDISTLGPSARLSGPDASGHFIYAGVAPGRYTISAVWAAASQFASVDLDVNGRDINGVQLSPQPAFHLAGRVVVDTTAPAPGPLTNARVMLLPRGWGGGGFVLNGMQIGGPSVRIPTVDASGAFEFTGIVPGSYQLSSPTPFAKGFTAVSAVLNGRDLLDAPVEIRSDLSGLVVTFSDQHSALTGTLLNAAGAPISSNVIIVMPADRALWGSSRRVASTQPATDGQFAFADLPPGDYLLVAVADLDPAELHDPALLSDLAGAGVKVTVTPGGKVRQDLRVK